MADAKEHIIAPNWSARQGYAMAWGAQRFSNR